GPKFRQRQESMDAGAGPATRLVGRWSMSSVRDPSLLRLISSPLTTPEPDDPRVTQALEEYLAALEEGRALARDDFLARHAEIAQPLAKCLDGLQFLRETAPRLHQSAAEPAAVISEAVESYVASPLGDFHIVREAGRGGMGIVYEAMQISLGR